jgi:hypothetical protein
MTLGIFGKRTSFKFSPLASQQLDDLRHRTRMTKDSDVLVAAIDVLKYLIDFVVAGGRIFIKGGGTGQIWSYSPYAPPIDYPHFSPSWSQLDETAPKQRRSFTFKDSMVDSLREIKAASRFQSDSDVVRAAIAVYHELLSISLANDRIIMRDKRGVDRPYNPFAAVAPAPQKPEALPDLPSAHDENAAPGKAHAAA